MELLSQGFSEKTERNQCVNCFLILVLYCCGILKGNAISEIPHGMSLRKLCIRFKTAIVDFQFI